MSAKSLSSSLANSCANSTPVSCALGVLRWLLFMMIVPLASVDTLCTLKPTALAAATMCRRRKKARESGLSEEAIEEANDAGETADQKAAFIDLLLDA